MTFTNEISISDITSALSVAFVILGGIFGYYQWRKNVLLKRAGYINDLTEKIRTDSDIKDVIYTLYGKELNDNISFINFEEGDIKVTGIIGNTLVSRDSRKDQIVFLNKRNIKRADYLF